MGLPGVSRSTLGLFLGILLTVSWWPSRSGGWTSQGVQLVAAQSLIQEGKFADAKRILEAMLRQPARPPDDVYYHIAVCQARLGEPEAAMRSLDLVLQSGRIHLPALHLKAYLHFSQGDYEDALRLATAFLDIRPDGGETWKIAGLARFMLGDKPGAERDLRTAAEELPGDFDAQYYLGRVYFEQGKLSLAVEVLGRAIAANQESVKAHNHAGQALEGLGRFDDAVSAYRTAIEIERNGDQRSEWPYYNLGALVLAEGNAAEAVELLKEALTRNPLSVQTKIKLGAALSAASRLDEAQAQLREAVAAEPDNADAHYQLGRLLMKMGEPKAGRQHLAEFERLRDP